MIIKIIKGTLLLLGVIILYFLAWPVSIEPVAYTPPKDPGLNGVFAKNNALSSAEKLLTGRGIGPEAIAMGPDSMLYTGFEEGQIVRFSFDGKEATDFANTRGRPLGLKFDANRNLIVADAILGLLSIDSTGTVSLLTNEVAGTKIFFADDLDIAADGTIYFSDATQRNRDVETEIWELQPTGRLLTYHPDTKETKLLLDGLRFANGIALGPNEDYLLITETFGMLIHKWWLKGSKKGTKEIWVNELPGFPDNITYNDNGIFWLAIPDLRIGPAFENLYDKPFLRKVIKRFPESMIPVKPPPPFGMIVGLDTLGKVVHSFQDSTGKIHALTSVSEFNNALYLGSLRMEAAGKFVY